MVEVRVDPVSGIKNGWDVVGVEADRGFQQRQKLAGFRASVRVAVIGDLDLPVHLPNPGRRFGREDRVGRFMVAGTVLGVFR